MGIGESEGKLENLTAKVNVLAYKKLNGSNMLYDGTLEFRGVDSSLHEVGKAVGPGFLRSVREIAHSISFLLEEGTDDIIDLRRTSDIIIKYDSNPTKELVGGSRGYTDHSGSYSIRSLNDSEMRELIKAVDKKVRPLLYK